MSPFSDKDTLFMLRALELAAFGKGKVSPNPLVGCVIVHNEKIIGEGWHKQYGKAHAEVNAIEAVKDKKLLSDSIAYVTLEPCSHFGKTPPCADLLVKHQLKKVVIASTDPNPLVNGKGIEKLTSANIDVEVGLLEEALMLNQRFFCSVQKKRPFIILKWAETADGFIARKNFDSKWISNKHSRKMVHKWRAEEDAIMVGTNTAKYDNPQLNVRDWQGGNPIRVVIDKKLSLEKGLFLFDGSQPTLCYNLLESKTHKNTVYVALEEENFLEQLLADLHAREIQSVIIEGGSTLLQSCIDDDLWDEARIFVSKTMFKEGIAAPMINGEQLHYEKIGEDELKIIRNGKN
ncbi:MAG: bifunctional diaminohydroxyphosphoribosylaminopyrimidine deaminase/5-amino-6-(5-phosphoribosylamino)uracil reductase RibD [Cyclobacteriaceae bacterium]|nr:bifunctional diaminohydroxyphosphoribosylaminopyrimidine deaminase/5-amino-6-(5-phosphoribosylamino)uracil reductase RibD [Cyclobacteriaceae bacterium]